jgi:uncharacterized protein (DUF1697 family)
MTRKSRSPSPARAPLSAYVALLRGINVGGKNLLPMADLVALFSTERCAHIRSYIQSGNVVFTAEDACARTLESAIPAAIFKRFGFSPAVVLRAAGELEQIVASNPFADADTGLLHVGFLTSAPDRTAIASLDPDRSPGDSFVVRGREIYLHLANGMGKTKLTNAYFDSKLKAVSTFRNWRTVKKLIELAGQQ